MRTVGLIAALALLVGCKGAEQSDQAKASNTHAAFPIQNTIAAKPASKIIGQWDVQNKLSNISRIYDFRSDGTYILTAIDQTPDGKGTDTVMTTGTYTCAGTKLTKHVVSMTESTDDEPMKSAAEADTKRFATEVPSLPEYSGTLKWKDDDNLVVNASKGSDAGIETEIVLKRHKG